MASGRPPRAAVRAAVRACLGDLEPGDRVVVALSGGADSLALTAAVVAVGAEIGLRCEAVVVDHQLQAGSWQVAARAAEQARILGCSDAQVVTVDVPRGSGSGGVEAAARSVRYAALDSFAGRGAGSDSDRGGGGGACQSEAVPPAAAILLGHTREDQAETVLLGLARGSGTRSLAGMAARAGVYRRPLLDLPRAVVVAAALAAAESDRRLEPWTDPHNSDAGFARVRVRAEVLPVLEAALGPGIVEALARTARLAREDADALDAWADRVWAHLRNRGEPSPPLARPATPAPAREAPAPPARFGDPFRLLSIEGPEPEWIMSQSHPGGQAAAARDSRAAAQVRRDLDPGSTARTIGALPIDVLLADAHADAHSASHADPHADRDGEPLPAAVVNRVIRRFLIETGCPASSLTAGHIRAVAELLAAGSPRSEVALPGGRRARREAGALIVRV